MRLFRNSLHLAPAAGRALVRLTEALDRNTEIGVKLMAAIDDLNAADAALDTGIAAVLTGLQTLSGEIASLVSQLATATAGNSDAAIETVVSDLTAKTASLTSGIATALAAIPATAPATAATPAVA